MTKSWKKRKSARVFKRFWRFLRKKRFPSLVSINDTVLPKTVPFPKEKRLTQGTEWHYSQENGMKIDMTLDMICSLLDNMSAYAGTPIPVFLMPVGKKNAI